MLPSSSACYATDQVSFAVAGALYNDFVVRPHFARLDPALPALSLAELRPVLDMIAQGHLVLIVVCLLVDGLILTDGPTSKSSKHAKNQ